jgi:hypothetical protein
MSAALTSTGFSGRWYSQPDRAKMRRARGQPSPGQASGAPEFGQRLEAELLGRLVEEGGLAWLLGLLQVRLLGHQPTLMPRKVLDPVKPPAIDPFEVHEKA